MKHTVTGKKLKEAIEESRWLADNVPGPTIANLDDDDFLSGFSGLLIALVFCFSVFMYFATKG